METTFPRLCSTAALSGAMGFLPASIEDRVWTVLQVHCRVSPRHAASARLRGDLRMHDLDVAQLCVSVEEHFGIAVRPQDLAGWITVADVIATVTKAART